jgi:hypothetical protein
MGCVGVAEDGGEEDNGEEDNREDPIFVIAHNCVQNVMASVTPNSSQNLLALTSKFLRRQVK